MNVIVLYLLASWEPQAVFVGDVQAVMACAEVARTYEVEVACVPVASENRPYVAVQPNAGDRPKANPLRGGVER